MIKNLGKTFSQKLVYGWGINDVDNPTHYHILVNGKNRRTPCPYYLKWKNMLRRCFDLKYQESYPTYKGCTICKEWKYLSNFVKWVDSQPNKDWLSCSLDKDFLVFGSKHYSPETCVFVPASLNGFITDSGKVRGDYMIGVCYKMGSKINPYHASCNNPLTKKRDYLGLFPTELEAHKAWQAKKHEYALQLADLQEDERVAKILKERYAPDRDWTNR